MNGTEWKIRSGLMREMTPITLPAGTAQDVLGVVDEVGESASSITVDESGVRFYAEYAVLSSWAEKAGALPFDEAFH